MANSPFKIHFALVVRTELIFTAKRSVFPESFRHSRTFLVREAEQRSRKGVWLFLDSVLVSPQGN